MVTSKYDGWKGLLSDHSDKMESIWWRNLKKSCGGLNNLRWFDKGVEWKVGSGDKIKFGVMYDVDLRFVPFVNRSGGVVSIWSK